MRHKIPKKRLVIKVGTQVLTYKENIAKERILELVKLIVRLKREGFEVILVSSGAIAAGYSKIKLDKNDTINKQVLASIGQPYLLSIYQDFFGYFNLVCSQVLLPSQFFDSLAYVENAKNTISRLLEKNIIPIINENDTVSIEELTQGDNDMLSAFVTHFFDADLLIILSHHDNNFVNTQTIKGINHIPKVSPSDPRYSKLETARYIIKNNKEMFLAFSLDDINSFLGEDEYEKGVYFGTKR
jgi:glutamate 5-kinase